MSLDDHKLEFPCQYPIKVIGLDSKTFKKKILDLIHKHFEKQLTDNLISFKHSKNKKYLSITMDFTAKSREHVQTIYSALRECDEVVFVM